MTKFCIVPEDTVEVARQQMGYMPMYKARATDVCNTLDRLDLYRMGESMSITTTSELPIRLYEDTVRDLAHWLLIQADNMKSIREEREDDNG